MKGLEQPRRREPRRDAISLDPSGHQRQGQRRPLQEDRPGPVRPGQPHDEPMATQMQVADAIRKVTAAMQTELEAGRRSANLDAHDLVEVLLAVADGLDPPFSDDANG